MWFFILSILLSTTSIIHGSEDSQLAIKELRYEISKVAREVQELYVDPDTTEKELDKKTKEALEEYVEMDISSGLPEQIELLDLKDKADDVKTSEETRKAVVDGLDHLGSVKEVKSDENKLMDTFNREFKAIEQTKEARIYLNNKNDIRSFISELQHYYEYILKFGDMVLNNQKESDDSLKYVKKDYERFIKTYVELVGVLMRITSGLPDIEFIAFDFLAMMKSAIAEGKERTGEIRKLKEDLDLIQKISSVKTEIKVMEELRDSEAVQKILDFMEKIKASFESIKGSGLDHFEWKITYFAPKWIPIRTYFKNLKVPAGDLTESLTKVEECLQNYDFSMDFLTEETDLVKIEEAFKDVRAKMEDYFKIMKDMEMFKSVSKPVASQMNWFKNGKKDWNEFKSNLKEFEIRGNVKLLAKVPELEDVFTEFRDSLKKLDNSVFETTKTATDGITSKISKIKEFLNCYSSLKIVPSEVKSLMDQPKEVWNFDARPLESVVEVVYLFKEAHRFLDKKEYPVPIDGFPLTKEEVTGISDGLGVLKAILDYQKLWTEIPQNFSSSPLGEEFSNLTIYPNLSDIQLPSDIDSTINFYSTQYQGPQQRRILKILESVKDYSQFPSKLEKMSEAVGKWKNWKKLHNPGEETVDGEFIDCFERTCELVLPGDIPEEPVKKVEL